MRSKALISAAVITISLALGLRAGAAITKAIAADLRLLDQELARTTIYDTNKERRLDSLKLVAQRTPDAEAHYRLCSRIGSEYMTFVADSATAYYYKALADAKRLQSHELKVKALIGITNSLAVSGFFSSAQIAIDTLADDVPPSLQIEYYNAARQLYYYMTDYAAGNEQHLRIFAERYHYYRDALIRLLPPESNICKYYRAEQLEDLGHYSEAAGILRNLLNQPVAERRRRHRRAHLQPPRRHRPQGGQHRASRPLPRQVGNRRPPRLGQGEHLNPGPRRVPLR